MTTVERRAPGPIVDELGYGLSDADQHFYEAEDAVTRHLEPQHRRAFRWIDLDGRRTLLLNNQLFTMIPNPTYDPVGRPGSMVEYFRAQNHAGRSLKEILGEVQRIQPEYRERAARLRVMDDQGVAFTWLVPSLGLGIEEPLAGDPVAWHAIVRSYNRWVDEDWGFDRDGRIQAGALMSLVDPAAGEAELARVLEAGARLVLFRPGPVAGATGRRSIGDPAHDRFWAMAAEAGVVVGFHSADAGYGRYSADWGEGGGLGWKESPFSEILSVHIERPVFDTMAALVSHGVFDRHPTLRVAVLEQGSGWVRDLVRRMRIAYGKMPQAFGRDPVESFREHVWVAPFYEDDLSELRDLVGTERILFGSDWPHPEGAARPADWIDDLGAFSDAERRRILRDNLRELIAR
jgi:predicted TIM-barrel fold metal-dependent hydrolase